MENRDKSKKKLLKIGMEGPTSNPKADNFQENLGFTVTQNKYSDNHDD